MPEDAQHPDYVAVRDVVRRVCDHAARHGQSFALETGQEPAEVLLRFIRDVDRPNLGINFDPANLILYGSGEPIAGVGDAGAAGDFGALQGWRLARTRRGGRLG